MLAMIRPVAILVGLALVCAGCTRNQLDRVLSNPTLNFRLEISGPSTILLGRQAEYSITKIHPDGRREDVTDIADLICGTGLIPDRLPSGRDVCEAHSPAVTYVQAYMDGIYSAPLPVTSVESSEPRNTGAIISSSVDQVSFRHTIGVSPCPQPLEGPTITNVGTAIVTLSVSSNTDYLRVSSGDIVLAPGESATIGFLFACGMVEVVQGRLTISARTSLRTQTLSIEVTGTVHSR